MKILILEGDRLEQKIDIHDRFIFLIIEKRVFCVDTSIGCVWKYESVKDMNKFLGVGHKRIIVEELKK